MEREIFQELIAWKNSKYRKPLIIKGARQVGKTWLMKSFGERFFKKVIYLNFEKENELKNLFELNFNTKRIVSFIEIYANTKIDKETLLIFDEIQESKGGLTSLKYFNEEMPQLSIICAGSLLGIAMKQKTSFPVGKVDFLNVYPLNFSEFLHATENSNLLKLFEEKDWETISLFKERFIQLLRVYYFVGGMPEAVNYYIHEKDLNGVRSIHENILNAYEQDFSKHAPNEIVPKIRMIWNSVVSQLAKENKKFIYGLLKESARAKDYEFALAWLEDYGLIKKVHQVSKVNFPLKAYQDLKSFKIYILDVGLLNAMANLNPKVVLEKETLFQEFKGSLTEQFVCQQLINKNRKRLFYWASDKGMAEIDFLLEKENQIIPLEVKASENLQAKSLKVFAQKNPTIHCWRTSLSNYREESWLTNLPLYGIHLLNE